MTGSQQRSWTSRQPAFGAPDAGQRRDKGRRSFPAHIRAGAAAFEFAVALPLLLLILVGILEFGRVGSLEIQLAQAARAGAEYGAFHPPDQYTLADWQRMCERRAREVLASESGLDPAQVTVSCTYTSGSPLNRVEVVIRHPFSLLVGWGSDSGSLQLRRSVVLPVIR